MYYFNIEKQQQHMKNILKDRVSPLRYPHLQIINESLTQTFNLVNKSIKFQ